MKKNYKLFKPTNDKTIDKLCFKDYGVKPAKNFDKMRPIVETAFLGDCIKSFFFIISGHDNSNLLTGNENCFHT